MAYFLGRGCVYIGERSASGAFNKVQEFHCPELEVEVTNEKAEHYNSCNALKVKDLSIATQVDAKCRMVLDTHDPKILAIALGGEYTEIETGATFSALPFPAAIVAGDILPVPGAYTNLASLTITDSAGSPATLTAGTNYTADLNKGLVTFINVTGFTQPFKAAGAENDPLDAVSIGTVEQIERFIRFVGVNIATDANTPVTLDLWRASINPSKFQIKNEGNEVARYEFEPMLLSDPNAPFSEDFGTYGRFVQG
ncbi:MAG TPA: hypothetical protein PLX39_17265 [Pyrinomonadaceae bacterium]|nr:hypothetical protein [Pyrinomonadaceae bacterium]